MSRINNLASQINVQNLNRAEALDILDKAAESRGSKRMRENSRFFSKRTKRETFNNILKNARKAVCGDNKDLQKLWDKEDKALGLKNRGHDITGNELKSLVDAMRNGMCKMSVHGHMHPPTDRDDASVKTSNDNSVNNSQQETPGGPPETKREIYKEKAMMLVSYYVDTPQPETRRESFSVGSQEIMPSGPDIGGPQEPKMSKADEDYLETRFAAMEEKNQQASQKTDQRNDKFAQDSQNFVQNLENDKVSEDGTINSIHEEMANDQENVTE